MSPSDDAPAAHQRPPSSWQVINSSPRTRRLIAVLLVDQVAAGAFFPVTIIYLTVVQDMTISTVGALLTAGGIVGLVAGPFLGRISDRIGAQRTVALANITAAAGYAGLVAITGIVQLVAALVLISLSQRVYWAGWPVLAADQAGEGGDVDWWLGAATVLRSAGVGIGAAIAAGIQAIWGPQAIVAFLLATVAASSFSAVVLWITPALRPAAQHNPGQEAQEKVSLRASVDAGFWLLWGANTLLTHVWLVPSIVVPYVLSVDLGFNPAWTSVLFALATLLLVAGQTTVTRQVAPLRRTRAMALGCAAFALCLAVFATLAHLPTAAVIAAAIGGVVIYSAGEMLIAPPMAAIAMTAGAVGDRGRNSAIFQTSWTISSITGPALLGLLLARHDGSVWPALIAAVAAGLVLVFIAERHLGATSLHRPGTRKA